LTSDQTQMAYWEMSNSRWWAKQTSKNVDFVKIQCTLMTDASKHWGPIVTISN